MKCLRNLKTGTIVRVDDRQADQMVGSTWQYVSKTEWKTATRIPAPIVEAVKEEIEKKKNPKQDFPNDNGKEFVKTRKKSKQ